METGAISFVELVEDFVNSIIKLIKAFFALLGAEVPTF